MRKGKSFFALLCVAFFCLGATSVPSEDKAAAPRTHTNSTGMEFVLIPAGSFMMGTDLNFGGGFPEETQHRVIISKTFWLGKYEVTREQWVAVMRNNPPKFKSRSKPVKKVYWNNARGFIRHRSNPVEQASWLDAQEFIRRLNAKEGHTRYRLPTEAEWEYAARAGATTPYAFGDNPACLEKYAWYRDNSGEKTHPVGQKTPNAWGLYDMAGNVSEWVQDWYDKNYYRNSPAVDPRGPESGTFRVLRGGSWHDHARYCRLAYRNFFWPDYRGVRAGFRLALSLE